MLINPIILINRNRNYENDNLLLLSFFCWPDKESLTLNRIRCLNTAGTLYLLVTCHFYIDTSSNLSPATVSSSSNGSKVFCSGCSCSPSILSGLLFVTVSCHSFLLRLLVCITTRLCRPDCGCTDSSGCICPEM